MPAKSNETRRQRDRQELGQMGPHSHVQKVAAVMTATGDRPVLCP